MHDSCDLLLPLHVLFLLLAGAFLHRLICNSLRMHDVLLLLGMCLVLVAIAQAQVACNMPGQNPTCMNGGECIVALPGATPSCVCKRGYTGRACEIVDACLSMRCQNGAGCVTSATHGPRCMCLRGFYGTRCETATCMVPFVCQNGGTCVSAQYMGSNPDEDPKIRIRCDCAPGFSGSNCETRGIPPSPSPTPACATGAADTRCLHGGTCASTGCVCMSGWIGATCANEDICVTRNPCPAQCAPVTEGITCQYPSSCTYPLTGPRSCVYDYTRTLCHCGPSD